MTREQLADKGIEFHEGKFTLDDINSLYSDVESFLFDWFDYDKFEHNFYDLKYWITETDGKYINILVWLESDS